MKNNNNEIKKGIAAVLIYTILILLGNWADGGKKDPWDKLVKWVKKEQ